MALLFVDGVSIHTAINIMLCTNCASYCKVEIQRFKCSNVEYTENTIEAGNTIYIRNTTLFIESTLQPYLTFEPSVTPGFSPTPWIVLFLCLIILTWFLYRCTYTTQTTTVQHKVRVQNKPPQKKHGKTPTHQRNVNLLKLKDPKQLHTNFPIVISAYHDECQDGWTLVTRPNRRPYSWC